MKPFRVLLLAICLIVPLFCQVAHAAPDGHRARGVGVAVTVRFGAKARERRHQRRVEKIKRGEQLDALKSDRRAAKVKRRRARRER